MRLHEERGGSLIWVLILILILAILGGAYITISTAEVLQSVRHSDRTQAYYFARSGAEIGLEWVLTHWENWHEMEELGTKQWSGPLQANGLSASNDANAPIDLKVEFAEGDPNRVWITSTGRFGNPQVVEQVQLVLEDEPNGDTIDFAEFSGEHTVPDEGDVTSDATSAAGGGQRTPLKEWERIWQRN